MVFDAPTGDASFELSVTRSEAFGPDSLAGVPEDAQVWRDWSGMIRACGYTRDGQHWIRLRDVAAFRFAPEGNRVAAFVPDSMAAEEVGEAFKDHLLPFALQALGRELLHASAVDTPSGALAFCGSSGAGKSTLASGLAGRGHTRLADDALIFERRDDGIVAIPMSGVPAVPLAGVFVLERTEDPAAPHLEIEALPHRSAFPLLLYHAHCFSFADDQRTGLMIDRYFELAVRVPTFRLRYRPDLERLPDVLDGVQAVIE